MFGSQILDVAIGLVFLFLLLSLVASSIKEAFETVLKYRARDLYRGLCEMFDDEKGTQFVQALYRHPLIDALFQGKYMPGKASNLPSYIPPRTFAIAVMDLLKPATATSLTGASFSTVFAAAPETEAETAPPLASSSPLAGLRQAAALSENVAVRRAILPLIDAAGNDSVRARENIEDWYNGVMDRVSGWYKRRTQIFIAAIALSLSFCMNVDTVGIARYLETSPMARSIIIARSEKFDDGSRHEPAEIGDPLAWIARQGGVPVGWAIEPLPGESLPDFARDWRRPPVSLGGWLLKIAGILFTSFAITLGAPFWFDLLNKFMVVRSTVKPQEKSLDERSKA